MTAGTGPVIEAVVLGRVGVDFTPADAAQRRSRPRRRSCGQSAGSPATSAPASPGSASRRRSCRRVGDDGHGEHVRTFLAGEGLDVAGLVTRPGTRTQVAFFEAWPPETFPVTFYRPPRRPTPC